MTNDIGQWLEEIGLGKYVRLFVDNEIDRDALAYVTEDDLEKLGVALGARRKILAAVAQLEKEPIAKIDESSRPTVEISAGAERRQLTVMFCDMVGSTALSTRIDAEDYREVIRIYQDTCAGMVTRYDGYVARFMGDGVLAYFGWPRAHEDDAARAINAALGLVDAVASLALPEGEDQPIAVRIGIATGPVVIGDIIGEGGSQEAAATGETLNLASRLEALADANTVVISDETHALASGLFDYESLGPQTLKGIDSAPEVWRVVAERQVESRFAAAHGETLTPLIGREEELDLLKRRWQRSTDGEGQVVLLAGEPGIGKSRLTRALQDAIGGDPHTTVLLQCSPHHTSSALYPVIRQLEFAARFGSGDDPAERLDKLRTLLSQGSQPKDDEIAHIASLLSIPADEHYPLPKLTPQQQKDRTLTALNDHLAGLAAEKPVLFVLEDAHWIDPTTLELVELAIERIRDLPVLIVVTYRPEFTAPWIGEDHVTLLALNRLSRKERSEMAEALIGELALSPEALAQIAERSDGIPLFIEELTKSVGEAGMGKAPSGDRGSVKTVEIPATLQDALEARFDRSPAVREVAQVGAAIGREFRYDLLSAVTSLAPSELDTALEDLTASGLIFARGTPPDASYTFKHALVQDTAYDSMVRSKRKDTHNRVAQELLSLRPAIADSEPETLAHHYTEADLLADAADWWMRAGQAARRRSANKEAVVHLSKCLELFDALPEHDQPETKELEILIALGSALMVAKGFAHSKVGQIWRRAHEVGDRLSSVDQLFPISWNLWLHHHVVGEVEQEQRWLNDVVRLADLSSTEEHQLEAHHAVWTTSLGLGELAKTRSRCQLGVSIYSPERHHHCTYSYGGHDPGVCAHGHLDVASLLLGHFGEARSHGQKAIELAENIDHGPTITIAHTMIGFEYFIRREPEALLNASEQLITAAENFGPLNFVAYGHMFAGWANAALGRFEIGLSQAKDAIAHYKQTGAQIWLPRLMMALADIYFLKGDLVEAFSTAESALQIAEDYGERLFAADYARLQAEIYAAQVGESGNLSEKFFRQSIEVASQQEARLFELRASTGLARLLHKKNRIAEAQETLSPVYNQFAEGFDMPDLKAAKAVLDELA